MNHVLDKKQGYLIAKNGCTSELFCQSIRCWNQQIGSGFHFLHVSFQKSPMLTFGNSRAPWTSEKEVSVRTARRCGAVHSSFLCFSAPLNPLPLQFSREVVR